MKLEVQEWLESDGNMDFVEEAYFQGYSNKISFSDYAEEVYEDIVINGGYTIDQI